jgi:ribosomal protein S15P/S13E
MSAKGRASIAAAQRARWAIVEEDDPETLTRLIAELTEHLQQDQKAIKAKISQFNKRARH